MRRVGYQGDEMDEESRVSRRMRWMRRAGYHDDEMDEESRASRRGKCELNIIMDKLQFLKFFLHHK